MTLGAGYLMVQCLTCETGVRRDPLRIAVFSGLEPTENVYTAGCVCCARQVGGIFIPTGCWGNPGVQHLSDLSKATWLGGDGMETPTQD